MAWEQMSQLPRWQRNRSSTHDQESARRSLERTSSLLGAVSPASKSTLLEQAKQYESSGQLHNAEECYIDILRGDPRSSDAYWGLTTVYQKQKSYDEALETLAVLAKLEATNSQVWCKRGELLWELERFDEALAAIGRAHAIEPSNPKYLDYLCEIAILSGNRQIAQEAWNMLKKANPDNQKLDELKKRIRGMK